MAKNHPKKPTDNDATVRFPAIHYKLSADISTIPSEFPPDLHCKADAMSSCLVLVLLSLITLFISCINFEKKWSHELLKFFTFCDRNNGDDCQQHV
jgi:hypothetical protein